MTQKVQNTAAVKRTASQSTKALITAKCKISDLHSDILNAMELVWGDYRADKYSDEIYDNLCPVIDLVDRYIIESINSNMSTLDSTEF